MSVMFFLPGFYKRAVAFGFLLLFAQSAQAADDPLKLFKNYFLTGDVAYAGKSQPIRRTGNLTRASKLPAAFEDFLSVTEFGRSSGSMNSDRPKTSACSMALAN